MMDGQQAIDIDCAIQRDLSRVDDMLKLMHKEKGWKHLGFSNWSQYLRMRVSRSASWFSRQLKFQETCEILGVDPDAVPESVFRALYPVENHLKIKIWRLALRTAYDANRLIPTQQEIVIASQRILDMLSTDAIEDGDGNQYPIDAILATGARNELTEQLRGLGQRHYIITARPLSQLSVTALMELPPDKEYMFAVWQVIPTPVS